MKLIIQIPCCNEEKTLAGTLDHLPKELPGIDVIEYLVINDGSADETERVAREWGVHHIISFPRNRGLAKAYMAGSEACLMNGADIIVNTDADNQYPGEYIAALIAPILHKEADITIGDRRTSDISHFSFTKKVLQRFGSYVVRKCSGSNVADATCGFRAFSRKALMRLFVVNDYTYTLETIIQASLNRFEIVNVPIAVNPPARPSRLMRSSWDYVKKSILIIIRALLWHRPLTGFSIIAFFPSIIGLAMVVRFLIAYFGGSGAGHIQSLILASALLLAGFFTFLCGLLADAILANRKINEQMLYLQRKQMYDKPGGGC